MWRVTCLDVLRVSRASAISAEEQRTSSLHRVLHHAVRALEVGAKIRRDAFRGRGEVAQGFGERSGHLVKCEGEEWAALSGRGKARGSARRRPSPPVVAARAPSARHRAGDGRSFA